MRFPLLCLLLCSVLVSVNGCGSAPSEATEPARSPATQQTAPTNFDAASSGTITGLVTWTGPIPEVAPMMHVVPRPDGSTQDTRLVPLATAPRIDRFTRGLGGAVVFLREVNPASAKPWDLPPVSVELRDLQIVVRQGERAAHTGFVRRGDSVQFKSTEWVFHNLRARGAVFFSIAFPDPDSPVTRTFEACGRVELSSAAGYSWQAADLFVCDHPYYTISDDQGRFRFIQVPAGSYDLVAWHPNWGVLRTERNPETGLPSRLIFAPPLESSRPVAVTRGGTTLANLTLPK